jgi:hypothetical protein
MRFTFRFMKLLRFFAHDYGHWIFAAQRFLSILRVPMNRAFFKASFSIDLQVARGYLQPGLDKHSLWNKSKGTAGENLSWSIFEGLIAAQCK